MNNYIEDISDEICSTYIMAVPNVNPTSKISTMTTLLKYFNLHGPSLAQDLNIPISAQMPRTCEMAS